MDINGKKVLTLPQQVLQNQKDISELKEEVELQETPKPKRKSNKKKK